MPVLILSCVADGRDNGAQRVKDAKLAKLTRYDHRVADAR